MWVTTGKGACAEGRGGAGQNLFEHLPAAATVVNVHGRVLEANAEARRLAGKPIHGETCRQYWRCRIRSGRCPLLKAVRRGSVHHAKVAQGGPHGRAIERISVFKDAAGHRRAIILTGPATAYFKRIDALRSEAKFDGLSRVFNRRSFDAFTARALNAERRRQPAAFFMVDIDGLKSVNDRFGHAAGDRLIQRLGRVLAASARRGDIIGRVGGDEFAIYCPGAERAVARRLVRRIANLILADNAAHPGEPALGAQVGLSCASGPRRVGLREMADRSLLRLKSARHRGRPLSAEAICVA
jgi:diguanylate cyclase (GGDEF)-like protein